MSEPNVPNERDPLIGSRYIKGPTISHYILKFLKNSQFIKILTIALVIGTFFILHEREQPEGYVIYNANIYTVDEKNPKIEAFVVLNGKFVDVGTRLDLLQKWTSLKHIDLGGRTVIPGLIDAHAHLMHLGDALTSVNLVGAKSTEDINQRIYEYLKTHPDTNGLSKSFDEFFDESFDEFIQLSNFEKKILMFLQKDLDTDPILTQYAISLVRIDGHALWVNGRVLDILGKDKIPLEIDGGEIVRDKETGQLTGIFVDNAMRLIPNLKAAIYEMHSHGLTGIHDAGVLPKLLKFYKNTILSNPQDFNIRNYAMVECENNTYCGDQIEKIEGLGDGRLTVRSAKMFMDGALGSWGAGDKANHLIINAYEKCFKDYVLSKKKDPNITEKELTKEVKKLGESVRFRIEHAQILTLDDIKRVGELRIIPSMQPTHATSDMKYAEQRLGSERIKGAYAWRSFIDAGVKAFPLSSDFPIESVNPFLGFYAAITRKWTNGDSPHGPNGWFPSQKLTREEALRGFTIDAAYSAFNEDILGSITVDKYADFVVIDRDIMNIPEQEIINTAVLTTVFNGQVVFGDFRRIVQ
ncbi:1475_t:CDS:10 [Cetraspora pellucida]|uniref:1475_t:CDS:1 n=1 Tax=Cetraspora pellucida TaxID=1433469 RepID=A0A9N9DPX3_9GLOM|nr:1475_t:CDS:10 [Cetraspora pellucida]